jgi:hypothetical protein
MTFDNGARLGIDGEYGGIAGQDVIWKLRFRGGILF